ncbi:MAG: ketoacyl-ACP synthase III [Chitinivibrionales bacterium]|nr:ketoacyl-ACP synthase III [Chitinivibrionales bacterium]
MGSTRARILSIGTAVPDNKIDNHFFEKIVDTSDEWIVQRTGIKSRYFTPAEKLPEAASDLGALAIANALKKKNIPAGDIDTVICATCTPDFLYPSTACTISAKAGCKGAFAFDLEAACSGFIYGLTLANSLIMNGQSRLAAVVGVDILSRTLDLKDRSTCVLFGDGAGAAIVGPSNDPDTGILGAKMGSDGTLKDILKLSPWEHPLQMNMKGNEVFKYAVRYMVDISRKCMISCGITTDDIDYFVPHQANLRIISAVGEALNLPAAKIVTNLATYGNTSAASIPLAFEEIWDASKIVDGTVVLFTALGGGITYGSCISRF